MKCPFCSFECTKYPDFVKHYVKKHRLEKRFQVMCGLCDKTFGGLPSLKYHVGRIHGNIVQSEGIPPRDFVTVPPAIFDAPTAEIGPCENISMSELSPLDGQASPSSTGLLAGNAVAFETDKDSDSSEDSTGGFINEDFTEYDITVSDKANGKLMWESTRSLLRMREEAMVSDTAVSKSVNIVETLFKSHMEAIKEALLKKSEPEGFIPQDHVLETFATFQMNGIFHGLNSHKLEDCAEGYKLEFLEPIKIPLFTTEKIDLKGNLRIVEHNAYASPFLPSLKRLLTRPDVQYCLNHPIEHEEGVYKTYMDGSFSRSHPILSQPNSLAIQVFYDDLEVSSPLGPVKHKLSFYYWTLLNLHPKLRGLTKSINLLAVAWCKDLKAELKNPNDQFVSLDPKYSHHYKILEPFFADLKTLEEGIIVQGNDGQKRQYKGALLNVTGDTPAIGVLSGTKESVGPAHKPCHHCLGDHYEVQCIFKEDFFQKRNATNREAFLRSLREATLVKNREDASVASGLNGPSVFEQLSASGFDQVQSFLFDAMHILHEGILEVHMRLLLNYYVNEKKLFQLETINTEVRKLSNKLFSKDRPAPIKSAHLLTGLRQSASQMLSLALCLPLVLMSNCDDEGRLENFVLLLKIVNGFLCYEITDSELDKLHTMIEEHHGVFMVHYPDFDITPKFHFAIHLVSQLRQHGPTRFTWCMRYEANHRYFKAIMEIIRTFKNPPKSLSYRYESLRACQMMTPPGETPENFLQEGNKLTILVSMKVKEVPMLKKVFGNPNIIVQSCQKVLWENVSYGINDIVLLKVEPPTFGSIQNIYVYNEICVLSVSVEDHAAVYDPLSNTFKFEPSSSRNSHVFVENLAFFKPLPSVQIGKNLHVIPKYCNLNFC